jgi:phosphoglycerate dehydrogenase-like enzyme
MADAGILERLRALPRLKVVQLPSAGYEHALGRVPPGVIVCNARGVHDAGTAELAVGLVLASQRGIDAAVLDQLEGRWAPRTRESLADRRVMILGYGSIGTAIARRLAPFEVELVAVARTPRVQDGVVVRGMAEVPELLPTVDVVILIAPLTEETSGLVDATFLARMRDGALLVNMARGKIVDTDALLAEVTTGRLRAALDVTEPEPLPADHPLWHAPGVIITPHVAGNTRATDPRLIRLLRKQIARLEKGDRLLNVIPRT